MITALRRISPLGLWMALVLALILSGSGMRRAGGEQQVSTEIIQEPSPALQTVDRVVGVDFRNRIPGVLDNPVFDGRNGLLSGPHFVAQLYQLVRLDSPAEAYPVGRPLPFGTGADAGYWVPDGDSLIRVPVRGGCCVGFQVRIWDSREGNTFESAGRGPRAVSRFFWFFSGNTSGLLDSLGLMTLAEYEGPAVVIRQSAVGTVYVATAGDVTRRPLWFPGFLGQLYVQVDGVDGAFDSGHGGVPVGPVASVGYEGSEAGRWDVDEHQVIPGLPVPPAQTLGQGGSNFRIQLRVWDRAMGLSYEECLRNGGRTGFAGGIDAIEGRSSLTGFARLMSAPNVVLLQPVLLRLASHPVMVPPGLGLFTNPMTNQVALPPAFDQFFSAMPEGLLLYHFDPARQTYSAASHYGSWFADWAPYFAPGEGFFVFNPSTQPISMIFPGAHGPLPALVRPVVKARFHCRGNTLGRSASWQALVGLSPVEGDGVFRFVSGRWQVNTFAFGAWDQGEPVISVDEAVFVRLQP